MSFRLSPALASTARVAGAGPMPIMRGATPTVAVATTRARGVRPCCLAAASDATISMAAPSLTPEALPAVIVPSGRTTGFSLARLSMVVARGCSSWLTMIGSPFFWAMVTGVISAARRPLAWAAEALAWLRRAKASWSSRLILKSTATFSAVSGMASTPNAAFMAGLTKRQPMVVS